VSILSYVNFISKACASLMIIGITFVRVIFLLYILIWKSNTRLLAGSNEKCTDNVQGYTEIRTQSSRLVVQDPAV